MPIYVIPRTPSASEQIARGLCDGLKDWTDRKLREQEYDRQVATQVAAQERLMEIQHQQKMQEMAYQRQLDAQKRTAIHHEKITHSTSEIGSFSGSIIIFCIIAILFVAGMATLISMKPANKI